MGSPDPSVPEPAGPDDPADDPADDQADDLFGRWLAHREQQTDAPSAVARPHAVPTPAPTPTPAAANPAGTLKPSNFGARRTGLHAGSENVSVQLDFEPVLTRSARHKEQNRQEPKPGRLTRLRNRTLGEPPSSTALPMDREVLEPPPSTTLAPPVEPVPPVELIRPVEPVEPVEPVVEAPPEPEPVAVPVEEVSAAPAPAAAPSPPTPARFSRRASDRTSPTTRPSLRGEGAHELVGLTRPASPPLQPAAPSKPPKKTRPSRSRRPAVEPKPPPAPAPEAEPTTPVSPVATAAAAVAAPPERRAEMPGTYTFAPVRGSRRLLTLVLLGGLAVSAYLVRDAVRTKDTMSIGLAAIICLGTVMVWAVRAGASVTRMTVHHGQLEVVRQGSRFVFDLQSTYTPIEVRGSRRRGWKVIFARRGMAPFAVDKTMVDPDEFMKVLTFFRPHLAE